ncbi:MAG: RNA-binding protein [Ignavibacteriaceae bacterium]
MNIYVGNLASEVTEEDLKNLFSSYGNNTSVKVIKDMYTGSSKGFGFIELSNQAEAQKAISDLNGKELRGKSITVNEARPKNDSRSGSRGRSFNGSGSGNNRYSKW